MRQEDSVKQKAKGPHMAAWPPSPKQRPAVRPAVQLLKWELGRNHTTGLGKGLAAGNTDY